MDEDVDPFLEYDHINIKDEKGIEDVAGEDKGNEDEGRQRDLMSSPIFNTPNTRFSSNQSLRRIRKPTSDLPTGDSSLSRIGVSLGHINGPPSSPENLFILQHSETNPTTLKTPANKVVQEAFSPCRSESEEDIFISLPSTAGSQQIISSAINELISCPQPADVSWTSSMATPLASNVTYSNLNTEERKVLLPSDDCGVAVKPRALFSPGANNTTDCHSFSVSLDAEHLQNLQHEKFIKTPKFANKIGFDAYSESPLENEESTSPVLKCSKNLNEVSRGSPILSGSSEFKQSSNHKLICGDEDLFDNADEIDHLSCKADNNQNNCSAESTPNIGSKKKTVKDIIEAPNSLIEEENNAESFLQDISVTALEEVCKAQELKSTSQAPSVTPGKEKQIDSKRKRLLFSSNLPASNAVSVLFKTPESKARDNGTHAPLNGVDNIIPDDSFMEHLAAMNTSIFGEEPSTKVQSIRSSITNMTKFSYSVHQKIEENSKKTLMNSEPRKLMREMLTSVLALESCSSPSNPKIRTVKSTGDLVVFSQLIGKENEAPKGTIHSSNHVASMNFEDNCEKHEEPHSASASLPTVGFQTANGHQITVPQEAIDRGLSVLKEAMEDVEVSSADRLLSASSAACVSEKQVHNPLPCNNEKKYHTHISSNLNDDQVEKEVNELLKLVKDGEDFNPWHEIEQPVSGKYDRESEVISSEADPQRCTIAGTTADIGDVAHNIESPFAGFSTASGKNILVSKEKLAKAEELLRDTAQDSLEQISKSGTGPESEIINFDRKRRFLTDNDFHHTTANKRACLETVTSALKNEEGQQSNISSVATNEESVSTLEAKASNESINISEEALNIVISIFGNKPVSTNMKENHSFDKKNKVSGGFLTAGGKAVRVSQKALKEAKNLFADIPAEETCQWKIKNNENYRNNPKASSSKSCSKEEDEKSAVAPEIPCHEKCLKVPIVWEGCESLQGNNLERSICPHVPIDAVDHFNGKEFLNATEGDSEKTPEGVGFATANGKKITVSEKSIAKVKNLFNDTSLQATDLHDDPFSNLKEFSNIEKDPLEGIIMQAVDNMNKNFKMGTSTRGEKTVDVSGDSFNKARNLFSDIPTKICFALEPSDLMEEKHNTEQTKSFEIQTSLKLPKELQQKCVLETASPGIVLPVEEEAKSSSSHMFSTASGKAVNVSKQALNKVKDIFKKSDLEVNFNQSIRKSQNKNVLSMENSGCGELSITASNSQGFLTASGKNVSISTDALNHVKDLFHEELLPSEDFDFQHTSLPCHTIPRNQKLATSGVKADQEDNAEPALKMAAFSTAGGKTVHISEEALIKAKNIFDELPTVCKNKLKTNTAVLSDSERKSEIQTQECEDMKAGISTVGGKSLLISKEALNKAQVLFDTMPHIAEETVPINDKNHLENHPDLAQKSSDPIKIIGFCTAAGNTVQVSKEAIEKSRKLLEELPTQTSDKLTNSASLRTEDSQDILNEIPCFTTAAGKSVCVTKGALKKAESLFQELPLETANKEEIVVSVSKGKLRPTNSVSDDSGVGLSCESTSKSFRSSTSLTKTPNVLDMSLFPKSNKENQTVSTHRVQSLTDFPKSSLTQEITASTAAFLADGEFFHESESLDVTASAVRAIKTSPSMVCDRSNSLKPILSSALDNKKSELIQPTSPILVRSDSMGTRRRTRKGRLSLSSNPSLKSISPSHRGKSENRVTSCSSLPPKMTSPLTDSASNKQSSVINILNKKCDQDLTQTVKNEDNIKEYPKLPPSRKLFDHGGMTSAELDTPNAKSIGITPLSESEGTPSSRCNNDKIPQSTKSSHQPSLVKRALSKIQSCPSSGFKTPYKTKKNNELKRSSSSPAENQPEVKKRKPCTNLYVSHIYLPSNDKKISGGRDLRPEVAEMRRRASEEQKHLVENFAELKCELLKPCVGTWFSSRSNENFSLKSIKLRDIGQPTNFFPRELIEIGLTTAAVSINADSSAKFRFSAWDYYSGDVCKENVAGLPVGDGALLVLDIHGTAGVEEFERAFLASPGVDPALVPCGWVSNHYRWIVWKLASLERMFPYHFAKRCFTPHMVMLQLKYRYDREVDRCERPALRRILEQDDSAAKRIVLCVAGIVGVKDSHGSQVELELTDGWYSVIATIDTEMQHRVRKGIIKVGTKLITHGSELLNCTEGCSPLQAHPDIRLRLSSNSTRRARWYTKLGFQDNPGPMKISLASILSSGGPISCFSAYVARVYPIVYMEKTQERTVVRSQRAESKEVTKSERKRQQLAEAVYSQVQSELQVEQSKKKLKALKFSFKNLPLITSGEELCDILENSADPTSVQCMLTEEQKGIVADFQRQRHEELRSEMEERVRLRLTGKSDQERQVTAILKIRLLDCNRDKSCSALLSVWRPSEDVSAVFQEGQKITIFGAVANGTRCGDLQLSASRSTRYVVGNLSETRSDLLRTVFPFDSLIKKTISPSFGELDIVGIVIRITLAPQTPGNATHFQTAYVSDSRQNIIGITFWEGIKAFAVEDLIKPCVFIAASNLQWRVGSGNRAIPSVYVSELSCFSANPKPTYLQSALQSLRRSVPNDLKTFCKACEDKLDSVLSSAGCSKMPNAIQPSSNLTNQDKPASSPALHPHVPPDVSLEAVVKAQQRLSPKSHVVSPSNALPSPAVEKRIAKLEKYGEPPPISPILISQPRRSLKKAFKAPRRTDSPSTNDIVKKN